MKERKKEAEWLGEPFEDDVEIVPTAKKKKSKKKKREDVVVSPSLNFVVATYYKGTGIEEVLKKMEKHLDEASKDESQINNI